MTATVNTTILLPTVEGGYSGAQQIDYLNLQLSGASDPAQRATLTHLIDTLQSDKASTASSGISSSTDISVGNGLWQSMMDGLQKVGETVADPFVASAQTTDAAPDDGFVAKTIKKYGYGLLAIILGLVFIVGGIYIYRD